jgi:hypothetical protein
MTSVILFVYINLFHSARTFILAAQFDSSLADFKQDLKVANFRMDDEEIQGKKKFKVGT